MQTLGIDPGATGGIAVLKDRRLVAVHAMPTFKTKTGKRRIDAPELARIIRSAGPIDLAVIELVGPMPRDGSAGSFWFGKSAGIPEGIIAALGVPIVLASPVKWKRRLDVPANKTGARSRASKLFPNGARLWPLVKDDGKAEAALIALWGYMDAVAGTW